MTDFEMIVGAKNIGAAIGVPAKRIYEMVERGTIPVIRLGGGLAIRKTKLAEWIEQLEAAGV